MILKGRVTDKPSKATALWGSFSLFWPFIFQACSSFHSMKSSWSKKKNSYFLTFRNEYMQLWQMPELLCASKLLQKEPKQIVLNSASSEDELCPEWTTALRLSLLLWLWNEVNVKQVGRVRSIKVLLLIMLVFKSLEMSFHRGKWRQEDGRQRGTKGR